MKLGILGYPVTESMSYKVFNKYFELIGEKSTYDALNVQPEDFEREVHDILREYDGFNVTKPFKEKIMRYIALDENAKNVGAVNCVFKNKGYNTDWKGFVRSLEKIEVPRVVTLVGAGGASRALLYGLLKLGVERVYLVNRTFERAVRLSKDFGDHAEIIPRRLDVLKDSLKESNALFNATSVGMRGEKFFDISPEDLSHLSLVYDVIYIKTHLQEMAREAGITVVSGESMWYHQAIENLKIWGIPFYEEVFKKVFEKVVLE